MDTDSFLVHVKTDDIYKDIAKDVEAKFDNWNFDRALYKGQNKNGLMKKNYVQKSLKNLLV